MIRIAMKYVGVYPTSHERIGSQGQTRIAGGTVFDSYTSIPMTSTWFSRGGLSPYSLLGLYDDVAATAVPTVIDHRGIHDRAA